MRISFVSSLARTLLCKSSGNKYFRVRNMGRGKNRGGSSPYHSNLKTSCIVQVLPPPAVAASDGGMYKNLSAHWSCLRSTLLYFSRIGDEKAKSPANPSVDQNLYNTYIKKTVFNNWQFEVIATHGIAPTRVNTKNHNDRQETHR